MATAPTREGRLILKADYREQGYQRHKASIGISPPPRTGEGQGIGAGADSEWTGSFA